LFASRHEVHGTVLTHTLRRTQVDQNRQNRTHSSASKALKPAESQRYRHFLQLHWGQRTGP